MGIQCFRACGIPVFTSERRAIEGLARLADYHDRVAALSERADPAGAPSTVSTAVASNTPALDQAFGLRNVDDQPTVCEIHSTGLREAVAGMFAVSLWRGVLWA
ncbi:MAG: hypothetical protein JHC61_10065 [Burkholderiaceae bacterium]|nr:hypothetical protein [Burkholderiaceae bacterium]